MPTARFDLQTSTLALLGLAPDQDDWTDRERREISRLKTMCAANKGWALGYGCAEAGDPWCIVHDQEGNVVVHIARIGRRYIVAWATGQQPAQFASLKAAVDFVLRAWGGNLAPVGRLRAESS
jgi:hypothetical protein